MNYQQGLTGVVLAAVLSACGAPSEEPPTTGSASQKVRPTLAAHSTIFEKRIEKVTDGVYVAIGYALANSIMLEGSDGLVIVDVTESAESARAVYEAFRQLSDKPIKALIYTHNHADHVFGGGGFFPDGVPADLPVYAHDSTNYYINRFANIIRPAIATRSARMFGTELPAGDNGVVNAGIGPHLAQGGHSGGTIALLRPNTTFSDSLSIDVAGLRLELIHAPGETNDQLFVWLPDKRVLLPGDNIYKAFPNLYTIRGTLYRDVLQWAYSLDKMRALQPEFLVPSHTVPVSGVDAVDALLRDYRDAIQFVHDQTIRGINKGLGPEALARQVVLPPHLKSHPWLQEHYGRVSWSVRNIFNGYLGWFGGDATDLAPLPASERGTALVTALGGTEQALLLVERALAEQRYQWAAELATEVLASKLGSRDARHLRALKAEAFRALAYASENPNDRHYYLTQAGELVGDIRVLSPELKSDSLAFAKSLPISEVLASLPVNLDAENSLDRDTRVLFEFTDTGERYGVHVRRGVAQLLQGDALAAWESPDIQVTTTTEVLVEVLLKARGVPAALASGDMKLAGGVLDVPAFASFLLLFKQD